ncbi:ankyrin [Daldinia eschscholtzii]|nr:ankyrin [Daldinia eschscholtzii]
MPAADNESKTGSGQSKDEKPTQLHVLAEKGDHNKIEELLKIDESELNNQDSRRMTALVIAVKNKRMKAVDDLLKHHPNLYTLDKTGMTAFHWAAQNGDAEIMLKLLVEGNRAKTSEAAAINKPTDEGGSSSDTQDKTGESSAGGSAAKNTYDGGKEKGDQAAKSVAMNIDLLDDQWRTPLCLAAGSGDVETVKLLLEWGADERLSDKNGRAPIDIAAIAGKRDAIKELSSEKWDTGGLEVMPAYALFPNFNTPDKAPLGLGALVRDPKAMTLFSQDKIHSPPPSKAIRTRTLSGFKASLTKANTGRYGPWAAAIAKRLMPKSGQTEQGIIEVGSVENKLFYPSWEYLMESMNKFHNENKTYPRSKPVYVVTGMKIAHDAHLHEPPPKPTESVSAGTNAGPSGSKQKEVSTEPLGKDFVLAVCLWKISSRRSIFFPRESGILRHEPCDYGNYMVPSTKPEFSTSSG